MDAQRIEAIEMVRKARDLSYAELAQQLTDDGHPIDRTSLQEKLTRERKEGARISNERVPLEIIECILGIGAQRVASQATIEKSRSRHALLNSFLDEIKSKCHEPDDLPVSPYDRTFSFWKNIQMRTLVKRTPAEMKNISEIFEEQRAAHFYHLGATTETAEK